MSLVANLIAENEPSQAEVHHGKNEDDRSDDGVCQGDCENQHVVRDQSFVCERPWRPCFFQLLLCVYQKLSFEVVNDKWNEPGDLEPIANKESGIR